MNEIDKVVLVGSRKGSWPKLYRATKNGKVQVWRCWVKDDTIYAKHGQLDGKQIISKQIASGKNEGRANGTTAQEQAIKQAAAMVRKRLERKYALSIDAANERPQLFPMLACSFDKRNGTFKYPVYVQPKLDGCRCLAMWDSEGKEVQLVSRSGKLWNLPHISAALAKVLPLTMIADGELYKHGVGFQSISSWIKRAQPESKTISYWIYDSVDKNNFDAGQDQRVAHVSALGLLAFNKKVDTQLIIVPTCLAKGEADVRRFHDEFVKAGFEGAIVRLPTAKYLFGHRSHDLLKVKLFQDAEYKIIGFKAGKPGSDEAKCVIWICQGKKEFKVRPAMPREEREHLLVEATANPKKFIGKLYKVKFQELTEDGVPRFPVGIGFRDKRDM